MEEFEKLSELLRTQPRGVFSFYKAEGKAFNVLVQYINIQLKYVDDNVLNDIISISRSMDDENYRVEIELKS